MFANPIIIANWKCNPVSPKEARHLFETVKKELRLIKNAEVVISPPFVWLSLLVSQNNSLRKSLGKLKNPTRQTELKLAGQDCHWENSGPYTGQISPLMLKNLGCEYVLIGHSERRKHFQETDEIINKKLKAVLKAWLKPVLCVGEETREASDSNGQPGDEMSLVVGQQIEKGLNGISSTRVADITIAYEPVWAIGTGNACPSDEAMKAGLFIKKTLTKLYTRSIAERVRIIYGGSVNSRNAADYVKGANMNGLLVGGASLDASEFVRIIKNVADR